jgi:competence protein ComEA
MLKKLLMVIVTVVASIGFAFADVDVNKADQAALDGIKGIGPTMSKAILAERKKGGDFKDWKDLQSRVKGIGDKNSDKFSQAGLTVGGAAKPGAKPVATKGKATDMPAKADTATATTKPADKKDVKPVKP